MIPFSHTTNSFLPTKNITNLNMQVRNFSQLFLVFVVVLSSKQENVNSDPSVDELARHAGYYTLEHSKPARCESGLFI